MKSTTVVAVNDSIDAQQQDLHIAKQVLALKPIPRFFKSLVLPKKTKALYKDLRAQKNMKHEKIKEDFDPANIFEVERFNF
jgi:hypothetical protein